MEIHAINVCSRTEVGKGAARRLRRAGRIPAIAYDKGETPVQLEISPQELVKVLREDGRNALFQLTFDDGQAPINVMIKESQRHPLSDEFIHVDFIKIDLDTPVTVKVNVNYNGRPVGALRGGKIEVRHRKVTITSVPQKIPFAIDVNVENIDLGDVLRVEDLALPEGVSVADEYKRTALYVIPMPKNQAA